MATSASAPGASLDSLPMEVLIDIVSDVAYSPSLRKNLRLVDRRFKHIVDNYEHSITGKMLVSQFAWAPRQFPGLLVKTSKSDKTPGWDELAILYRRVAVLTNIKSRCKVIREGHAEQSAWTTCRALTFHHTGLLLLYRLADCDTSKDKAALIHSLPVSSLAVMLFTMLVSIHLLRAIGPSMAMYGVQPPFAIEERSDVELAMEELFLRDGPEFLLGLLTHEKKYIESLKTELAAMEERQYYEPGMPPPETTLIAHLRQAFAAAVKCEMQYNLVHMWYVLDEQCSLLSDKKEHIVTHAVERVVNGEPLEIRCGRCKMLQLYGA